jgi:predicted ATPase
MNLIAFSGTHGCGKTTQVYKLASTLKQKGYNVAVIDELARECPLPINKEAGVLTQFWIIASQMKREIELMSRYDYVIVDRTIFDTAAYAYCLGLFSNMDGILAMYTRVFYKEVIILDPNYFDYQINDGVRDMDPVFRIQVHNVLLKLYESKNVNYVLVKSEDELQIHLESVFKW